MITTGTIKFIASLTLLLATIILEFRQTSAIKCYVCQSNVDPKCADPFDNLTLPITDCDAYPRADLVPKSELDLVEEKGFFQAFGLSAPVKPLRASLCRKIRQKVNGEWRTIRGCGYLGGQQDPNQPPMDSNEMRCQIRHGTYDVFMETCACNNKDGCNAAHGSISSGATISMVLLFSLIGILLQFCWGNP